VCVKERANNVSTYNYLPSTSSLRYIAFFLVRILFNSRHKYTRPMLVIGITLSYNNASQVKKKKQRKKIEYFCVIFPDYFSEKDHSQKCNYFRLFWSENDMTRKWNNGHTRARTNFENKYYQNTVRMVLRTSLVLIVVTEPFNSRHSTAQSRKLLFRKVTTSFYKFDKNSVWSWYRVTDMITSRKAPKLNTFRWILLLSPMPNLM